MTIGTSSLILEEGHNVNGTFIRYADGTQEVRVKDLNLELNKSALPASYHFPAAFSERPMVTAVFANGSQVIMDVTPEGIDFIPAGHRHNSVESLVIYGRWHGGAPKEPMDDTDIEAELSNGL